MGLDMYLTGRRFIWGFDNSPDKHIQAAVEPLFPEIKGKRIKEVSCEMMYWRKSNQIHKWFVDKCQEGVDECQETYVTVDQLRELLDTCRAVLASRGTANELSNARALLPSQGGFFFGSTDYDDYYFQDIEDTVKGLEEILGNEEITKHWEFYYRSSW
jgi:hypothetical protein